MKNVLFKFLDNLPWPLKNNHY